MSIDPPPIDEQAPAGMTKLVRVVRDDGPSAAAMERMAKRLATAGALSPSTPGRPRAGAHLAIYQLGAVALAVAGGLMVAWHVMESPSPVAMTAPAAAVSLDRDTTEKAAAAPTKHGEPEEARTLSVSVDELPSAAPPAAASASGGNHRGVSGRPSTVSPGSSSSELELLQRAKAALVSDPEKALSITSEQARAYPSGEFVQEREVIAVEALARLGQKDEALRRARHLVEQFPRTPYATRLELALGRSL